MSLNEEDIKAVVFYRKEKAYATLREAEDMIETKHWNLAIQRMYKKEDCIHDCFKIGLQEITMISLTLQRKMYYL